MNGSNGLTLTNLSLEPTSTSDASLWGINLDTLNQEGIYTATLHFVGAALVSQGVYPDLNDSQIVFYRTTPDLWRGIKSGINALLVLVFIVVFAWASMEGFQRLWPPFPKGVITFKEQNPVTGSKRQIDMINLFSRRLRRRVITWKPNTPELKTLGIYKVVIRPRPGQRQRNNLGVEIEFFIRQKSTIPMIFTDKGQKTWPGVVGETKAVYWIEYTY